MIYAINREPEILDPHLGYSRYEVVFQVNIFDSLLYKNDDGDLVPWLANEVTMNADATIYTIKLRDGVTFHDGAPFNAETVKFNFDRIVDPASESTTVVNVFVGYIETKVIDGMTVEVHFDQSKPGFMEALSGRAGMMQSPKAISEMSHQDYLLNPVGTGPFMFVEWIQRDRLVMEKNPNYAWERPGAEHSGPPMLDEVIVRLIPEDGSRVAALLSGEVDAIMRLPVQDVDRVEANADFTIVKSMLPGIGNLLLLNGSLPPTDDIEFRKALQWATSGEVVNNVGYRGKFTPHLGGVMSPNNDAFIDLSDMYGYDLDRAAQILDDAGWTVGSDGIRAKNGVRASIEYTGIAGSVRTTIMEFIQADLLSIGVELTIAETEGTAVEDAARSGQTHIIYQSFMGAESLIRMLWHSDNIGGGWNYTHYADATLDSLIEQADTTIDRNARIQLYKDAQVRLMEIATVVPLLHEYHYAAIGNHVEGFRLWAYTGEPPEFYAARIVR